MIPLLGITTFNNIDLLFVGLSAAAIAILGFVIFLSNTKSATTQNFLFFALMTIAWIITNFLQYKFTTIPMTLLALRVNLFVATWHAFSFLKLSEIFPEAERPKSYTRASLLVLGLTVIVSVLTLTPFVFSSITQLAPAGEVTNPVRGPGLILFSIVTFGYLLAGLVLLWRKWRHSPEIAVRRQVRLVFWGMLVTAFLIISFNVILPVAFDTLLFLPFTGIFMFPFIGIVSYAIYRHHLFNLKVVAVEALTFVIAGISFIDIVFTTNPILIIARIGFLFLIIALSIILTQTVAREVEQREIIQKQEGELEIINAQQENLLHFISHEIKGYFTKSEAGFSAIAEGDFGPTSPELHAMADMALSEVRKGVRTVMDILDASNLKKGTVSFKKGVFDLKEVVDHVVEHLKPAIDEKHLNVEMHIAWEMPCKVNGDEEKIRDQVVRNLIDNAIKYTPAGTIKIEVMRRDSIIRLAVEDSGVGITPEDMARLFTEGGHGKDSVKINVHSTGYGLYIAKQVVDAHDGKIWAESAGAGKGSRFVVELPAA